MQYMLTSCEEKIANEWRQYVGYTVRPLPSTVNYYQEIFKHYHNQQAFLMYGGTPEIRTLFQDVNFNVVLLDRSAEMVRAMGRLTSSQTPIAANEQFVEMNWLHTHSLEKKFDLLIGDDAINMVSWKYFALFLQNAANMLEQNGTFICHLLVKPEDALIHQSVDEVMMQYQAGQIKSQYDLASRLNFICYDKISYAMGWQQTIRKIGKNKLNQYAQIFNYVDTFGLCNSQFYCPPQHDFECLANIYFTIEEIFHPNEHEYCLYEPVYLFKKR
jgi:hypothetical protein